MAQGDAWEQPEAHAGGVAEDRGDVDKGSSGSAHETSEAATPHADSRSWAEKYAAVAAPGSPFYSPPPSTRALRWSITTHVGIFAAFTVAFVVVALRSDSAVVVIVLLCFWVPFTWWRAYQVRAILKELARRRDGASDPSGQLPSVVDDDLETQEEQRRRRAAWQRVVHDVFPLLSNPSAFKRPFDKRNDWKD